LPDVGHEGVPAALAEVAEALRTGRLTVAAVVHRPRLDAGGVECACEALVAERMLGGPVRDEHHGARGSAVTRRPDRHAIDG
jgi:hypothetical protein